MILALKSRKLYGTTEAKKRKICIYISVPRNKELPGVRSNQKKGTWQFLFRYALENTDIGIKRD